MSALSPLILALITISGKLNDESEEVNNEGISESNPDVALFKIANADLLSRLARATIETVEALQAHEAELEARLKEGPSYVPRANA